MLCLMLDSTLGVDRIEKSSKSKLQILEHKDLGKAINFTAVKKDTLPLKVNSYKII